MLNSYNIFYFEGRKPNCRMAFMLRRHCRGRNPFGRLVGRKDFGLYIARRRRLATIWFALQRNVCKKPVSVYFDGCVASEQLGQVPVLCTLVTGKMPFSTDVSPLMRLGQIDKKPPSIVESGGPSGPWWRSLRDLVEIASRFGGDFYRCMSLLFITGISRFAVKKEKCLNYDSSDSIDNLDSLLIRVITQIKKIRVQTV
jgi:hypothetical protein